MSEKIKNYAEKVKALKNLIENSLREENQYALVPPFEGEFTLNIHLEELVSVLTTSDALNVLYEMVKESREQQELTEEK